MSPFRLFSFLSLALSVASHSIPVDRIKWTDCSKNVPQSTGSFNGSAIDLTNLPPTLHCGQIDVPMDYSKPLCHTNMITLRLAMYRPANPKGVLFFNPGGTDPGVVVAWEVALGLTKIFSELMDFDLLVMDVRGTFSSNPLNVSLETFSGLLGRYPTNQTAFNVVKKASSKVIQSWIDSSSPPGIIEHVGTREVVQDYESIRLALGYAKIDFLGASYGSFRAAQYAAKYPNRVNNFVLDAVVPHGRSLLAQAQDDIAASNRLMLRADAYCQNDPTCPFHTQGQGSVLKAFQKVLSNAKESPYFIPPCVNSTQCYPYVTDLDVQTVMLGNLLGSPDFPAILTGISSALSGDGSFFVYGPPPLEAVVAMPLLCNDYEYERTFEYFQRSLEQGLKKDHSGIGMTQAWQIQVYLFPKLLTTAVQIADSLGCSYGAPHGHSKHQPLSDYPYATKWLS
ncbi:Uncharacterized protein BP5553_04474 [Venustampulla echinocandica]|uniref:AB hydrolase-1 domain-containing protein n=1 Tax=Venustampulla echinocandica TaxID=2656787 RepID=A0A370TNE3_9HELO|nr:Uncharacterized protein BP5553_04474 [Venustampulla echinocandica]RDL37041.1 Uncharacterized protein BP5553_04474 [Venustampulla echinocandica]